MHDKFKEILSRCQGLRLAVVGDCMVDRFLFGECDRISPEAPVPVVKLDREVLKLGGAANVAANIRALGAHVCLLSACGEDDTAAGLRRLLAQQDIEDSGLVALADRPTTVKTRIIAQHQQIVRADREDPSPLAGAGQAALLARLEDLGPFDGFVLSDYGKGVLTDPTLHVVIARARQQEKVVVVDPKQGDYRQYRGATSLTPNQREAAAACAMAITDEASLARAGATLLERTAAAAILITRGEHGMTLFLQDGHAHHLPTQATEVFDVTGAGDTVIAAYTTALAAGADVVTAASLANHAAGVAVRELGTAAVTAAQVLAMAKGAEHA